jgi:hypothetical protein
MANWLQKIIPPSLQGPAGRNLPTRLRQTSLTTSPRNAPSGALPNASVIYGVAASVLFVIGLYFLLFTNRWVAGLLVMLPAGCFLGFALHFIKHPH